MYFFTLENIKKYGRCVYSEWWMRTVPLLKETHMLPTKKSWCNWDLCIGCQVLSKLTDPGSVMGPLPSSQKATETQRNIARIEKDKWMTDIYRSKKWKSIWKHNLYFLGYVASSLASHHICEQSNSVTHRWGTVAIHKRATKLRSQKMESYCVNLDFALSLQIWVGFPEIRQDSLTSVSHAPMTISTW